jgi:hypothetical protein
MIRKMNRALYRSLNEKMFLPGDVALDDNLRPNRGVLGYRSHRRYIPTIGAIRALRQILRHGFRLPSLHPDIAALAVPVPISCIDGISGKL